MQRSLFLAAAVSLTLAGCATTTGAPARDGLDAVARDYVVLQLAIGEKEEGYIDAFYGDAGLKTEGQALAQASDLPALAGRVRALQARVTPLAATEPRRAAFLSAQLTAAATRLRMLQGEKLPFAEEAQGLFGVRPTLNPLASYDPVLARIEALVPGEGSLADRVEAYQNRFTIPREKLETVFRSAIAACRTATVENISLPSTERFDLAFVTGKSWSGYNYYLGQYRSRIEINTDLPIRLSRAVDLGCHEGYPGHHVLNVLLEEKLVRGKGWTEFSVYPLYSPQSLLAEGSANYGIDLAFPGARKARYEAAVLAPLAGLNGEEVARYDALLDALRDLSTARNTIAQRFLDGEVDEAEAVRLTQRYQLVSEARARQSVNFTKQYRSYVINYDIGRDMVARDVERFPEGKARWQRMEQLLSEPTLPSDLQG
ncbi:hypothetical protein [Sphingomonas sp. LHG3406-1]|uniref:hypothetical protein n=1 Tax=Sphingomonas sp. LHG3406-1 TaxID=2804617 RepID=UPI002620A885|nr:hypothetical protein [Sphingomonas sp. LHG3406-1]